MPALRLEGKKKHIIRGYMRIHMPVLRRKGKKKHTISGYTRIHMLYNKKWNRINRIEKPVRQEQGCKNEIHFYIPVFHTGKIIPSLENIFHFIPTNIYVPYDMLGKLCLILFIRWMRREKQEISPGMCLRGQFLW